MALTITAIVGCGSSESPTAIPVTVQPTDIPATTAPAPTPATTASGAVADCPGGQGSQDALHTPQASGSSGGKGQGQGQAEGEGDCVPGKKAFTELGCNACHSTGTDTIIGPGLAGIGSRADDAYIEQSIREPGVVIVEGFADVMLTTFADMPEPGMNNLISYLKTLE